MDRDRIPSEMQINYMSNSRATFSFGRLPWPPWPTPCRLWVLGEWSNTVGSLCDQPALQTTSGPLPKAYR